MQTENGAGTLAIFLKDCGHNLYVSSQSDVGKAIPFPAQKCHAQIGSFLDRSSCEALDGAEWQGFCNPLKQPPDKEHAWLGQVCPHCLLSSYPFFSPGLGAHSAATVSLAHLEGGAEDPGCPPVWPGPLFHRCATEALCESGAEWRSILLSKCFRTQGKGGSGKYR